MIAVVRGPRQVEISYLGQGFPDQAENGQSHCMRLWAGRYKVEINYRGAGVSCRGGQASISQCMLS